MSYTPITSEDDIDALTRGARVEFFPVAKGIDIGPAVFLDQDGYGKMNFAYEAEGVPAKVAIHRHYLKPGPFDTLDIQERVTLRCPPPTMEDIVCFQAYRERER